MNRIAAAVLSAILGVACASALADGPDDPPSPADQYQALCREYDRASSPGKPLTDAERLKFIGQAYKNRFALEQKFLDLAFQYPKEPFAFDALKRAVWQVNGTPWPVELVGEDTAHSKAFELLLRDHVGSDKLGPLCQRIAYGFCREYETLLRAVAAKNPHDVVKATANLSLGHFLNNRMHRLDLIRDDPVQAKEFADLFGKSYLDDLLRQDRAKVQAEVESIFENAAKTLSTTTLPDGEKVADRAKAELYELRHLEVGRQAPEIDGEDQDGRRFHLRDYRGKVVLLDFWSYV